ncbi:DUF5703 domain-containing protein [Flavihumibacter petaseus]|uniref:Uncharacterized protein n=1 Tax=Flavihumibacter petaseus NBRC 106054 TaxID=1220578 RepID=A0A0E9N0W1_9BACT|nr:DUF5703 domain-containing protein [Flavihumibacter petaseus]GAO43000.1 hypothetical protein FPE01S_02_01050 [Flavihumibacter petaseus NBRC 106054]
MKKILPILVLALFALQFAAAQKSAAQKSAGALPSEIAQQLSQYNVSWTTMSSTGSMASMPLGNGDVTANVWVEKGKDLMLYIGKSDSWSEAMRLLKIGRVRVAISPNPFTEETGFLQTLDLHQGGIRITAGEKGKEVQLHIWIDANQPVVRVAVNAAHAVSVSCTTEIMRPEIYRLPGGNDPLAESFRGLIDSPVKPSESADVLVKKSDRVQWYHRNETSWFDTILAKQQVAHFIGNYRDPYLNRTFGAALTGTNMRPVNDSTLASGVPSKQFEISVTALTAQTPNITAWDKQLSDLLDNTKTSSSQQSLAAHHTWWDQFWNRSWIFLSGDDSAINTTRAYILQRYLMACQSRGAYPVKYNGGALTFDYDGRNGDFRRWGPGFWYQNMRLLYWPMTAAGDFDLKAPWFNMYKNMLPLQTDITQQYYGHGGAFFPETLYFFGMYIQDDWGWNNTGKAPQTRWIRYHFSGALEMLSEMLDYYAHTRDTVFVKETMIPFATQAIRFFDQHWPRINGTIRFIPANATEQFWDCLNPTDYISGLRYTITQLNALPSTLVPATLTKEWNRCLQALPAIALSPDKKRILPAEEYGQNRNSENPECYVIFPFKLYGLGRPDIELANNTFDARQFKQTNCWTQDVIQAALLGRADLAKTYIARNVNSLDTAVRFPAFWKPGSDYIPDFDNGGVLAMGLQQMLLQNVDTRIFILPAFPASWKVDFKLHAFDNTVVRVKSDGNKIAQMDVFPVSRKKDVVIPGK